MTYFPKLIFLPMRPHNRTQCLNGQKTATSRTRKFGNVGDFFQLGDSYFELTNVTTAKLKDVAEKCFKAEGFTTSEAFIREWQSIHPYKGYRPEQLVYYHEFKKKY